MKILLVEDDSSTMALIQHYLKDSGFEVVTSRNGDDAFRKTLEELPDLALIDGLIPGIHGFELCKKIKEEPSLKQRPKIIIMSSVYKGPKYRFEVTYTYKADEYITKPFEKSELLSKIHALLKK